MIKKHMPFIIRQFDLMLHQPLRIQLDVKIVHRVRVSGIIMGLLAIVKQ